MGDVLTLIEKAQAAVDEEKAKELEQKMRTATFTLDDFLEQLGQVQMKFGFERTHRIAIADGEAREDA